jgi:hypothetical protein
MGPEVKHPLSSMIALSLSGSSQKMGLGLDRERRCHHTKVKYITPVKMGKPEEPLDLLVGRGQSATASIFTGTIWMPVVEIM